ncbi:MAG: tRNA (guanosine(46)-N7)-methyltransferase TrmB [Gammaproteobacteria bacterium]|nr:tRNA (guanosine(46)-N7)-methyltransferase TrmB [Gammaproteobacteria bacterium]
MRTTDVADSGSDDTGSGLSGPDKPGTYNAGSEDVGREDSGQRDPVSDDIVSGNSGAGDSGTDHPGLANQGASSHPRAVRSFVKRDGRITRGQQAALDTLWPVYGIEYHRETLDFSTLFGRKAPCILEIGFGNGDALCEIAQREPHHNFVGVEVHRPGIGHLLMRIGQHELHNVRISDHDAVEFLANMIAPASLERVNIWFPDPWPKKRHHKRRLIQLPFLQLLAASMRFGAVLHLATDWQPYAQYMLDVLHKTPYFENTSSGRDLEHACVARPDSRPLTKFERRGHRKGHGVWDFMFKRNDIPV